MARKNIVTPNAATRDVFKNQNRERSVSEKPRSKNSAYVVGTLVGVLAAILTWFVWSAVSFGITVAQDATRASVPEVIAKTAPYYKAEPKSDKFKVGDCYRPINQDGSKVEGAKCYDKVGDVPQPQWFKDKVARGTEIRKANDAKPGHLNSYPKALAALDFWKAFGALVAGLGLGGLVYTVMERQIARYNVTRDHSDISQHLDDQDIATPEEIQAKFDLFPNLGAHSGVEVSSMISHMMLSNKGVKQVPVVQRAKADVYDADGELVYYKGEPLLDEQGDPVTKMLPIIDSAFGKEAYEASGVDDKDLWIFFDPAKIKYNPKNKNRDKLKPGKDSKLKSYDTWLDVINDEWVFPEYETMRPFGAYVVDTAPVNTMVLAITRAGKGQTVIEPTIDMWMREKRQNNMVVNDPKGELLVKNYVRATVRGYQVIQFNLINVMKTDIYNPLGMAAESAREGDSNKCSLYVKNIAEVFFPTDSGDDPVWANSANNAFQRAAYGLIDFYLEEEREMRIAAALNDMDPVVLEAELDEMWGKVTLYNCYQLFVQLSSKKVKNPVEDLKARAKTPEFMDPDASDDEAEKKAQRFAKLMEEAEKKVFLWEDKPEVDMLSLYFAATEHLPQSVMRTMVANANNSLKSMGGAEKMLASVYGIAITAMSFFTDPTISMLTSGRPSQNVDLGGLSFPRRMGVRFDPDFLERNYLKDIQVKWEAYSDDTFTTKLDKSFDHSDTIDMIGWARYYFDGKFPTDDGYVKLMLVNPQSQIQIRTFYFHFKKSYQLSLNSRYFITDPVTGEKLVKNGVISELLPVAHDDGTVHYEPGHSTFAKTQLTDVTSTTPKTVEGTTNVFISSTVRYTEKPKAVFLVTPPHLMGYAKLILILLKQLVDLNFDKSYMTKSNQKPLYKTRFMLDELGNLQSEGHGIANFETMLSIGLGQEQQFTIILQTLQQLRDVYGESVDRIVQGNVNNIMYLKSTDDAMLDQLSKMSGTTHKNYQGSKTVTQDMQRIAFRNEGKVSFTISNEERAVVTYNDLYFISPRNSILFRAGDPTIWNRNETILPMSFKLFGGKGEDSIIHPGHEYTLQTIPTLSSAIDFDVRTNQPDFVKMLNKRIKQACVADQAKEAFRVAYGYDEDGYAIAKLDPDVYSTAVMNLIGSITWEEKGIDPAHQTTEEVLEGLDGMGVVEDGDGLEDWELDEDLQAEVEIASQRLAENRVKRYAGGTVAREDLVDLDGRAIPNLEKIIMMAYQGIQGPMGSDGQHFTVQGDTLCSRDGRPFIGRIDESSDFAALQEATEDENSRAFSDEQINLNAVHETFRVYPEFYQWLASLNSWSSIAGGRFEAEMARAMRASDAVSIFDPDAPVHVMD